MIGQVNPYSGGSWDIIRAVLSKFKNDEILKRCFKPEEYCRIKLLRENAVISKAIVIK
jgi:uncharacterized protein (DUF1330 family)